MDNNIIDEIQTNRIEKNEKLFKYLAILTGVLAVLKIILRPEILSGDGSVIDYIISLSPIFFYFYYQSKTSKHKGQFIKWTKKSIEYKSKDVHNVITIDAVQAIKINLDSIDIQLKDGSTQTINIHDYTEYDDRLRIKSNFEKITTTPNSA